MILTASPNFASLRPYHNYYILGNISEYQHRFEVFFTAQYQFTLMLKGNSPEDMRPDPHNGVFPAAISTGPSDQYQGSAKMVDGEPAAFRNVAPIPPNLKPLADAVEKFIREKWHATEIKLRYEGFKREIILQEVIRLGRNERQDYKGAELKALHESGNDIIDLEGKSHGSIGMGLMFNNKTSRFISFMPSEAVQGRMFLRIAKENPELHQEWRRFSKIVLDMIDKNINLPFTEVSASFKQYIFYNVKCFGRKPLLDTRVGIPFKFFQDDEATHIAEFAFEISDALKRTITQTKEIAKLNLKINVSLSLSEMRLDLKVTGIKKEHVETIKFAGKIGTFEGQPVLESNLKAIADSEEGGSKKRRDSLHTIELVDGEKYEYISIYPEYSISPNGL